MQAAWLRVQNSSLECKYTSKKQEDCEDRVVWCNNCVFIVALCAKQMESLNCRMFHSWWADTFCEL